MSVRSRSTMLAMLAMATAACGGSSSGGVVTPVPPPPPAAVPSITTQAVFTQLPAFNQPVALKQAPGDTTRWIIAEKRGVMRVFANNPNTSATSLFLDMSAVVDASGEGGLLGFAFHPDFPLTPEVFVSYTRTGSGTPLESYVSRFTSTNNGQTLNPNSEEVLLTLPQAQTNHNGGDIAFGSDGYLYIAFGDSGGAGDPRNYAQNTTNLHGAIVRIDVEGGNPYAIPAGNPFEANPVCGGGFGSANCPEIFAWGLRNPWRISFDRVTDKLWAGDVGQDDWEEVNVIEAGNNYGWNEREGAHCFPPGSACGTNFTDPVTEYDHGVGGSVTGGYVYRGSAISDLVGWYVFGDFVSGRIFAVREASTPVTAPEELLQSGLSIVSFAEDNDDELYVLDYGGTIHEIRAGP